jgi:hypothetical protein
MISFIANEKIAFRFVSPMDGNCSIQSEMQLREEYIDQLRPNRLLIAPPSGDTCLLAWSPFRMPIKNVSNSGAQVKTQTLLVASAVRTPRCYAGPIILLTPCE